MNTDKMFTIKETAAMLKTSTKNIIELLDAGIFSDNKKSGNDRLVLWGDSGPMQPEKIKANLKYRPANCVTMIEAATILQMPIRDLQEIIQAVKSGKTENWRQETENSVIRIDQSETKPRVLALFVKTNGEALLRGVSVPIELELQLIEPIGEKNIMETFEKIKGCFDHQFPQGFTPDHTPVNCPKNKSSCRECSIYLGEIDVHQKISGKSLQQSVEAMDKYHERKGKNIMNDIIICDCCGVVLDILEQESSLCKTCLSQALGHNCNYCGAAFDEERTDTGKGFCSKCWEEVKDVCK